MLNAGDLILRKDVEIFEKNLADYIGVKYAVALNSCTDALYLALRALKIGPGDKVMVPSRTFVATAQAVVQVGAIPVFYDLNDYSDEKIENMRAIIPVHIEGTIQEEMGRLAKFCKEKDICLIEDVAQALGASQGGKMAGSFGDVGCFSFYPAKILGSLLGDAGALTTNNEKLSNWIRGARNHFKETAEDWGINSRMDNPAAACLNIKFKYLPEILKIRQNIAEKYLNAFKKLEEEGKVKLPKNISGRVWQDFIIQTSGKEERNKLFEFLKEKGIETMKNNYPFPVPKMVLAQKYEDSTLRSPCNENLSNEEVDYVIEKIKEFYENT